MGRPSATSHAAIEAVAFRLFAERGFEETTLEAIAAGVGVGRRTLFRYYASKNDIPWGRFDLTLARFRELLRAQPAHLPLHDGVGRAVVAFNDFPPGAQPGVQPDHATRMRLILGTPALQAHSALRYAEWRAVVAEHVAERTGEPADALVPQLWGHLALGVALTAYEQWLRRGRDDAASLRSLLQEAVAALAATGSGAGAQPLREVGEHAVVDAGQALGGEGALEEAADAAGAVPGRRHDDATARAGGADGVAGDQ